MQRRLQGELPGKMYFEECNKFPQNLKLYIKHIDSPGDDYLEHIGMWVSVLTPNTFLIYPVFWQMNITFTPGPLMEEL